MTDMGLASVLPLSAFLLVFVLAASFALALAGPVRSSVMVSHVVVLIVMLYGVTAFIEAEPRFGTVWKHVGIIDHIATHGSVDPNVDAYFNWPGFFILGAVITQVAGFGSPLAIAAWGPLAFNLLLLPPLLVLFRAITEDRRLIWLSLWFFYSTNWVGQDYIAPQAVGFLLWVSIAAILMTWFVRRPGIAAGQPSLRALIRRLDVRRLGSAPESDRLSGAAAASQTQRAGLFLIVVGIFAAIVTGHQLTPVAVVVSVAGLAAFAGLGVRGLPWVMAIMLAAWIGYMTTTYLAGNIGTLTGPLGSLGTNLDQNVSNRLTGSREHEAIAHIRVYTTAGIWLLAMAGFALRRVARRSDRALVVLGTAPFIMPVLQPYGGEMLLRVFLFTLPAVAFFTASLVIPSPPSGGRGRTIAGATVLGCLLLGVFQYTRYGNERLDYFTKGDVAAVQALYRLAPRGSALFAGGDNIPWRYRDYTSYEYHVVPELEAWKRNASDSEALVREIRRTLGRRKGAYVIVTRSTEIGAALLLRSPQALQKLVTTLRASPAARELYRARDGSVFYVTARA
jgi:hypothetical protein